MNTATQKLSLIGQEQNNVPKLTSTFTYKVNFTERPTTFLYPCKQVQHQIYKDQTDQLNTELIV